MKSSKRHKISTSMSSLPLWSASVLAMMPGLIQPAWAQTALEEIVVTAQRRAESLQDSPIAITTVTANDIRSRNMEDISQVANVTPNLTFDTVASTTGASSSVIFIRGIGQLDFALTTDPGVGVYVDGVYIARSVGGVLDVVDIQQIEVLRGPQGTLFGRNTIGGALNITSRKPAAEFGGELQVSGGNNGRREARASFDLPASESLQTRVVAMIKQRDGFVRGDQDGRELGEEDRKAVRFSATAALADNFKIDFSADYTHIDEQSAASILVDVNELPPGSNCNPLLNPNANGNCIGGGPTMAWLWNNADVPISGFTLPPFDQRWVRSLGDDRTSGTGPNGVNLEIGGAALTAAWELDNLTLKSIFSYRKTDGSFERDGDSSPAQILHTENPEYKQEQLSAELQAVGSLWDGRLTYVAGVYYFDESGRDRVFVFLPPSFAYVDNLSIVDSTSIAGYGQATFAVTDDLNLTAGIRYNRDKKKVDLEQYFIVSGPVGSDTFGGAPIGTQIPLIPVGVSKDTFNNVSPKIGIDYKFSESTLGYASVTRGFKSGGFNFRYLLPRNSVLGYRPETVTSYEVGLKWEGFDRRVRLNSAAFYAEYKNIQTIIYENGAPLTQNAGAAEIKGFEIELDAVITEGLRVASGIGFTDAEYTKVPAFDPNLFEFIQVTKDKKLPKTPKWSFNAAVMYSFPLGSMGDLLLRADWTHVTGVYNDAQNAPQLYQSARSNVDLSATFDSSDDRWSLQAGVKNLTDKRYILGGDANFGLGHFEANINRPREWYVRAVTRF